MKRLGVLAIAIAVTSSDFSNGQTPSDPKQLVESIFTQREKIKSFHLRAKVETRTHSPSRGAIVDIRHFEVWQSGDSTRTDHRVLDSNHAPLEAGGRSVRCRNCEKAGHGVAFDETKTSSSEVLVLPLDKFASRDDYGMDWRLVGLLPGEWSQARSKDPRAGLRLVASDMRSELTRPNHSTVLIKLTESGIQREITLTSEFDHNPTRFTVNGNEIDAKLDVEYEKVNGISFPKLVTFRQQSGKLPPTEQKITLETVELNVPIDPSVFTLAGMQLRNGVPVSLPNQKKSVTPTWQGEKLDYQKTMEKENQRAYGELRAKTATPPIPDQDPTPSWFSRAWPYLTAAGLSLLALLLLRRNAKPQTT